jgi:hypothetical protein
VRLWVLAGNRDDGMAGWRALASMSTSGRCMMHTRAKSLRCCPGPEGSKAVERASVGGRVVYIAENAKTERRRGRGAKRRIEQTHCSLPGVNPGTLPGQIGGERWQPPVKAKRHGTRESEFAQHVQQEEGA